MSQQEVARLAPVAHAASNERRIAVIGLALALGYLILLVGAALHGNFLFDVQRQPIANDFVNVWAAGQLVLAGDPAAAYDWSLHKAAEIRAVGHSFANYYGWHYPPTFLFVAAALALLPYVAAASAWLIVTLVLYAATLAAVFGSRAGIFLALGFPAALWNVTAGQNGFLTATLVGGTLVLLEQSPAAAGICLGLLSYKPQLGLLFPIVLIADRRWRTTAVAGAVAISLAALSYVAFGGSSWLAFAHWMPITERVVLGEGAADWGRLQSVFGFMRAHGAGESFAWGVQAAATLTLALGLALAWRSRLAFELKAAGLAAGSLLATPYLYMYDLVVLAVAVAFLLRFALARGFAVSEIVGLAGAGLLMLSFPQVQTQVGLAAVLIVMSLIVRHAFDAPDVGRQPARIPVATSGTI